MYGEYNHCDPDQWLDACLGAPLPCMRVKDDTPNKKVGTRWVRLILGHHKLPVP